jgi:hypothetical protein
MAGINQKVWTVSSETKTSVYFGLYGVSMVKNMIPLVTARLMNKQMSNIAQYPGESGSTCAMTDALCKVQCTGDIPFSNSRYTVKYNSNCTADIVWSIDYDDMDRMPMVRKERASENVQRIVFPWWINFVVRDPYEKQTGDKWAFVLSYGFAFGLLVQQNVINGTAVTLHIGTAYGVSLPDKSAMVQLTTSTVPSLAVINPGMSDQSGLGIHPYSTYIQNNGVTQVGYISRYRVSGQKATFTFTATLCLNALFSDDEEHRYKCTDTAPISIPDYFKFDVPSIDTSGPVRSGITVWSFQAQQFDYNQCNPLPLVTGTTVYLAAITIYLKRDAKWNGVPYITYTYLDIDGKMQQGTLDSNEVVTHTDAATIPLLDKKIVNEDHLWVVLAITPKRTIVSKDHSLKYSFHGDVSFKGTDNGDHLGSVLLLPFDQVQDPVATFPWWAWLLVGVGISVSIAAIVVACVAGIGCLIKRKKNAQYEQVL